MRLSGSNNFDGGSPQAYAARMGVNRVRREPAVSGSYNANNARSGSNASKSNSRTRAQEYSAKLAEQRRNVR